DRDPGNIRVGDEHRFATDMLAERLRQRTVGVSDRRVERYDVSAFDERGPVLLTGDPPAAVAVRHSDGISQSRQAGALFAEWSGDKFLVLHQAGIQAGPCLFVQKLTEDPDHH